MIRKNLDKMIIGAALAIAASALVPIAKTTLRPIAHSGIQGAMRLVERAKTVAQTAKEELEDMIAEARFERMKKKLDREIALHSEDDSEAGWGNRDLHKES